jgi:hypothetical protein
VDILELEVKLRLVEARIVDALTVPHRRFRKLASLEMYVALGLELRSPVRARFILRYLIEYVQEAMDHELLMYLFIHLYDEENGCSQRNNNNFYPIKVVTKRCYLI